MARHLIAKAAVMLGVLASVVGTSFDPAVAQDGSVKIGVLSDMSGLFSDFGGPGSVVAARMAVEDFGGSVLGKPVEVVAADHQNKPDVGSGIVRRWYDGEGVDIVVDVLNSGIALPVQTLAQDKGKIVIFSGLNNRDLSGKLCSANGMIWGYDSYSLASLAPGVINEGGKSWFFITINYTSGQTLEQDTIAVVKKNGGTIAGAVRYSLGTKDFASFLLQAQGSGADVIALATGGADMQAILKQAAEFGVKQRVVPLFTTTVDLKALGLDNAKGVPVVTDFYWDQNEKTRAFAVRFKAKHGKMPTDVQATVYSATLHYLKAVAKAGTKNTAAVLPVLKATPVEDFMTNGATVRADGRLMRDMYFAEVKAPTESKGEDDVLRILARIPAAEAWRPAAESDCPLLKKS